MRFKTPDRAGTHLLQGLKRSVFIAILAALAFSTSSCVYFNTFYNAKKYYKKAEQENKDLEEGNPPRLQNYQKSLDTAAKVPEFYPHSKYVDDALMLMGKCYYKMEQYPKAQRKFEELISNYPASKHIPEAKLYLGRSMAMSRSFERARQVLTEIVNMTEDAKMKVKANFALGQLLLIEEKYTQAAEIFRLLGETAPDKDDQVDAYHQAGECYFELKNYQKAAEMYKAAAGFDRGSKKQRFEANYKWAVSLRDAGDLEGAEEVLQSILKKQKLYDFFPTAQVELAEIQIQLGDYESAFKSLEEITINHTRTAESSRAYYNMAKIERDRKYDYEKAEEYFNKVQSEKSDSPYADSARTELNVLTQWKSVSANIDSVKNSIQKDLNLLAGIKDTTKVEEDTTTYDEVRRLFDQGSGMTPPEEEPGLKADEVGEPPSEPRLPPISDLPLDLPPEVLERLKADSLNRAILDTMKMIPPDSLEAGLDSLSGDTIQVEPAGLDTAEVLNRIEENRKKLRELQYQMAEVWYFQLSNRDSSLALLNTLIDSSGAELASKSLFLKAHIYKQRGDSAAVDSIYRKLVDDYGESSYANAARRWLGMEVVRGEVDSAAVYFHWAEETYFNDWNLERAWDLYTVVDSLYPESNFAPKAIFARAMMAKRDFYRDSTAIKLLTKLKENYPKDTLATIAGKRLTKPPEDVYVPQEEVISSEEAGEEEIIYLSEEVDIPATCAKDSAAITDYLKTSGLYPSQALAAGMKGVVTLSIIIDKYGYPGEIEIIDEIPTGYGFGDAAAEAAENFEYTAGMLNRAPVPMELELKFHFVP